MSIGIVHVSRTISSFPQYSLDMHTPWGYILFVMNQDSVVIQLKKARGQIDGVLSMYEQEKSCLEIVRQIIASRNALTRVARDLLTTEANRCSRERRVEDLDEVLAEVFKYS